jgi:hypothetical protein
MGAIERRSSPDDLSQARSRFQAWRAGRKVGERIPAPLWEMAARLAKTHGVSRTATVLGLDYYSVRKRIESAVAQPHSGGPAFVEWPSPIVVGKECRLELDNGAGAIMRVHLVGYDAADVEALSRSFWNAL